MSDTEQKTDCTQPPRLCSEIQLFDLCDLDSCRSKSGRFCTNQDSLVRFEKIADSEERARERFVSDEFDEEEGEDEFGSGFSTGDLEDGDEEWRDEDE
jgi:hypothetical protein